ncbi:homocysteine-responsive endoplasmic reticulum-resident ubiquitin-like domain member 2 protein [Lutzomyia longipalpis]|uniref:homocysteine-responsive endoplasmic reticulum-resident ubiquitin-like domain member 2 protein n=1 Tax=Lutzomyia longipalpis TaxID=7200 RepID=UPI0024840B00|nr:homocysteine-responsive endoplasmic reticulum-resident ubiquitin-like domain member 2 protein [Lutzomyia longipalpis]XP_055685161.1 homocysteine-responsive endoplasmic reticulum-resident ubiquitin-like domain member 2 protein [Lutzomyia longipalpis]
METIPVTPVTLIVKAPNQQFEDQTIKCELSWTIKKLKGYLSEVYPCKPSTDEQKLIYSGQLLNDAVVLKDILRQYEGQETHTVHLVFTPKMNSRDGSMGREQGNRRNTMQDTQAATEGLRQRRPLNGDHVAGTDANNVQNTPSHQTSMPGLNGNMSQFGRFSQQQVGNFAAQHLAYQQWLQQAYVDYMNQYVNLMSRPDIQGIYQPYVSTHQMTTTSPQVSASQVQHNPAAEAPMEGAAAAAVAQPPQNPPQPRFPNLVRDDGPEQRDWLDTFYAFSRLMVLGTLVYFYSSPTRCLIVIAIGVLIYLYHTGFFRNFGGAAAAPVEANNNAQRNNGAPAQQEQRPNAQQDAAQQVENDADEASNAVVRDDTNRTPVIAFLRTFVLSFFASLIPEAAAL